MNKFKVASRFDGRYSAEKCPVCRAAFQDFMELSEDLLACYSCGVAFVPKAVRDSEWSGKKVQLEKQLADVEVDEAEKKGPGVFECSLMGPDGKKCGKLCKSKLGLMAHQRKHKDATGS